MAVFLDDDGVYRRTESVRTKVTGAPQAQLWPRAIRERIEKFAEQIPEDVRPHMTQVQVFARMEEAERIKSVADKYGYTPNTYQAFLERANAITKAMAPSQLKAEINDLYAKAASACDPTLRAGYYQRIRDLEKRNPQVSDDDIDKADKTLTAMAKGASIGRAIAKAARR